MKSLLLSLVFCVPIAMTVLAEPPFPGQIQCEGGYRGHVQGVASDGIALYWIFTDTIVKTDWHGKAQSTVTIPNLGYVAHHGGDPCWYDGKLYVPYCGSGFNQELHGKPSQNYILVYDQKLTLMQKHHVPELIYGAGGIEAHNDHFYIVGGRPNGMSGNTVYQYDRTFKFQRKYDLPFHSFLGIQTINFDGENWWFGCYKASGGGGSWTTDKNFKINGFYGCGTSVGMIPVSPDKIIQINSHRNPRTRKCTATGTLLCHANYKHHIVKISIQKDGYKLSGKLLPTVHELDSALSTLPKRKVAIVQIGTEASRDKMICATVLLAQRNIPWFLTKED